MSIYEKDDIIEVLATKERYRVKKTTTGPWSSKPVLKCEHDIGIIGSGVRFFYEEEVRLVRKANAKETPHEMTYDEALQACWAINPRFEITETRNFLRARWQWRSNPHEMHWFRNEMPDTKDHRTDFAIAMLEQLTVQQNEDRKDA